MPKYTLLEMVQNILSDMSSDEVNSIDDTIESVQVAQIVKDTYFNIIDGRDWPHLYEMFQLNSSGDNNKPTHMSLPTGVVDLVWVKYNCRTSSDTQDKYRKIVYKSPMEFMDILDARDSDADNILVVTDDSDVPLNIFTDRAPKYYTSFDDNAIVFDAYDIDVDTTLRNSKTQCYGKMYPSWTHDDFFTPDLPVNAFSLLLNEAKAACFVKLQQAQDPKAEQYAVTQRRRMSQEAWRVTNGIKYPNYGRKGHK